MLITFCENTSFFINSKRILPKKNLAQPHGVKNKLHIVEEHSWTYFPLHLILRTNFNKIKLL